MVLANSSGRRRPPPTCRRRPAAALARTATFLIELLAAIPSVVYGFWGLFFLVPDLPGRVCPGLACANTSGKGIFTAAILLAVMIVPYITAVTYGVCRRGARRPASGGGAGS